QANKQRHKQVGGFAGAELGREVVFDAIFFGATERWVGNNDINPFVFTPVAVSAFQGVVVANLVGGVDAVQNHIGGGQQVRQGFFLPAVNAALQYVFVVGGLDVVAAFVFDGAG